MPFQLSDADLPRESTAALAVMRAAEAVDGVAALNEESQFALTRPQGRGRVVLARGAHGDHDVLGVLVDAEGDGSAVDLVVAPERRRQGIATALLARLQAELAASGHGYQAWAHGDLPAARALAGRLGLARTRDLWRMSRPMTPGEAFDTGLPDGFVARAFDGSDAEAKAWLAVNAAAFAQHPEQGRMTMADFRERRSEAWFDPEGLVLVWHEPSGALAASHWTKREPGDDVGEVYVVAVAPAYQGLGLARPLTNLGLAHLAATGVERVDLYVEGDNEAAKATYAKAGFSKSAQDVQYVHTPREEPATIGA